MYVSLAKRLVDPIMRENASQNLTILPWWLELEHTQVNSGLGRQEHQNLLGSGSIRIGVSRIH